MTFPSNHSSFHCFRIRVKGSFVTVGASGRDAAAAAGAADGPSVGGDAVAAAAFGGGTADSTLVAVGTKTSGGSAGTTSIAGAMPVGRRDAAGAAAVSRPGWFCRRSFFFFLLLATFSRFRLSRSALSSSVSAPSFFSRRSRTFANRSCLVSLASERA